jgi:putative Holliday junction resolvase
LSIIKNKASSKKVDKDPYVMGIDYGDANIGIAFGKSGLVAPIKIVQSKNLPTAINEIVRYAIENRMTKFVVGLPLTTEGKETRKSAEVRRFAKLLKVASKKQVEFMDEHSTTIDAGDEMVEFEIAQKKRRMKDHFSAALILKRYFDAH